MCTCFMCSIGRGRHWKLWSNTDMMIYIQVQVRRSFDGLTCYGSSSCPDSAAIYPSHDEATDIVIIWTKIFFLHLQPRLIQSVKSLLGILHPLLTKKPRIMSESQVPGSGSRRSLKFIVDSCTPEEYKKLDEVNRWMANYYLTLILVINQSDDHNDSWRMPIVNWRQSGNRRIIGRITTMEELWIDQIATWDLTSIRRCFSCSSP